MNMILGFNVSGSRNTLQQAQVPIPDKRVRHLLSCVLVTIGLFIILAMQSLAVHASSDEQIKFKRIPTQFIAALGDPHATSGNGAESWGLWELDPGPRGVWLNDYEQLEASNGVAPAQWAFNGKDWWLEEHGLIMEEPDFPIPPGRYLVTGDREAVTMLTIHPADENGNSRWELDYDVTLYDVTHLPCRSARYTPITGEESCSPANAQQSWFPVTPGASMPAVKGCYKQDYAVLFVIGVAVES